MAAEDVADPLPDDAVGGGQALGEPADGDASGTKQASTSRVSCQE